jgi:hypothetical protein
MLRETKSDPRSAGRTAPSLARAVEALRTIRGQRLPNRPERQVLAMRSRLA